MNNGMKAGAIKDYNQYSTTNCPHGNEFWRAANHIASALLLIGLQGLVLLIGLQGLVRSFLTNQISFEGARVFHGDSTLIF